MIFKSNFEINNKFTIIHFFL